MQKADKLSAFCCSTAVQKVWRMRPGVKSALA